MAHVAFPYRPINKASAPTVTTKRWISTPQAEARRNGNLLNQLLQRARDMFGMDDRLV